MADHNYEEIADALRAQVQALAEERDGLKALNASHGTAMSLYWDILAPEYEGNLKFHEMLTKTVVERDVYKSAVDSVDEALGFPEGFNLSDQVDYLRSDLAAANALNAELRGALEPFGNGAVIQCLEREDFSILKERIVDWHGPSDFRNAAAALVKSPAQSLADRDARVRREALEEAIVKLKPFEIYRDGWYGDGHRDAVNTLRDLISAQPAPARKGQQ